MANHGGGRETGFCISKFYYTNQLPILFKTDVEKQRRKA